MAKTRIIATFGNTIGYYTEHPRRLHEGFVEGNAREGWTLRAWEHIGAWTRCFYTKPLHEQCPAVAAAIGPGVPGGTHRCIERAGHDSTIHHDALYQWSQRNHPAPD